MFYLSIALFINKIKYVSFVVLLNINVCVGNNLFEKYEMYKYTYKNNARIYV